MNERKSASILYNLEDSCPLFKGQDEGIDSLRTFAARVLKNEVKEVVIKTGRGMPYQGRLFSYCTSDKVGMIVLSRSQRNRVVLLHELAHAIVGVGYGHSTRFRNKYFDLLSKYLGRDRNELERVWQEKTGL